MGERRLPDDEVSVARPSPSRGAGPLCVALLRALATSIRVWRDRWGMTTGSYSHVALCAALALALVGGCGGLDNGLGLTPPMGFNTWNYFGCVVVLKGRSHALTALFQLQRHGARHAGRGAGDGGAWAETSRRVRSRCKERSTQLLKERLMHTSPLQATPWWRWTTAGA